MDRTVVRAPDLAEAMVAAEQAALPTIIASSHLAQHWIQNAARTAADLVRCGILVVSPARLNADEMVSFQHSRLLLYLFAFESAGKHSRLLAGGRFGLGCGRRAAPCRRSPLVLSASVPRLATANPVRRSRRSAYDPRQLPASDLPCRGRSRRSSWHL